MYVWSPFPFVRFSIALIVGIIISPYWRIPLDPILGSSFFLILTIFLRWVASRWLNHLWEIGYGVVIILFFVFIGSELARFNKENQRPQHYSNYESIKAYQAQVVSDFSDRKNYNRYEVELSAVYQNDTILPATGKLFLYIRKQDSLPVLEYGDQLLVSGSCYPVQAPGNPHEFNYKAYLETLNIYGHSFVNWNNIEQIGYKPPSRFLAFANQIRAGCKSAIYEVIPEPREQSILLALLVGIKDYLDEETQKAYSQAGAMHVLAVSGLHVGIVYYLLNLVFGFLKRNLTGKLIFIALAIGIIWVYAGVTGFSPSVLRASVMFSVILISQTLSRRANIYNSLGIAALVLLLYDPSLVFSVGFQLSFAAVIGIVFLQPKLSGLWRPENKIIEYIWSITCVSIAAQLSTFPLTVYYFHQFPTYFLISNLIVIPAAAVILTGGIVSVGIYHILPVIGKGLGWLLSWIMWSVNELMEILTRLPLPVVDWLYFDFVDTVLVYAIILMICISFDYQLKRGLVFSLMLVGALFVKANVTYFDHQQTRSIVFYEIKDHIAIDFIDGRRSTLLIDTMTVEDQEVVGFQVNPNRLAQGLDPMVNSFELLGENTGTKISCGYVIEELGVKILIIDTDNPFEFTDTLKADVVYLNKPINNALNKIEADHYLLGADIGYYAVKRLREQMVDSAKFLHSLKLDGYFELQLSPELMNELER